MKSTRSYVQRSRANATAETRQRILDAATELLGARLRADIRLEDVAHAADTSVPTVLRAFGSKAALLEDALQQLLESIKTALDEAKPGDVTASVKAWCDHYERTGDASVRNLVDEDDPAVAPMVAIGRRRHRDRVRRQFGPQLDRLEGIERERTFDALLCICDVYTWKLLSRDLGRSRPQVEAQLEFMINSLMRDE